MEKLQRWSLISEIVAAIAVVLSIVYLAVEVQRNTTAIQTQTLQGLLEIVTQNNSELATDAEMADLILRGDRNFDELTETEQVRYRLYTVNSFAIWEHAFYSHLNGTMDPRVWKGYDVGFRGNFCRESGKIVWRITEPFYGTEFRVHVNETSEDECTEGDY